MTTKDLLLVRKINHEIFNIPEFASPYVYINIKLHAPSNFILQKVLGTAPDATVFLASAILHLRKKTGYKLCCFGNLEIKR